MSRNAESTERTNTPLTNRRPARNAARTNSVYVNSYLAISDHEADEEAADVEESSEDDDATHQASKRGRKRARVPSPPGSENLQDLNSSPDPHDLGRSKKMKTQAQVAPVEVVLTDVFLGKWISTPHDHTITKELDLTDVHITIPKYFEGNVNIQLSVQQIKNMARKRSNKALCGESTTTKRSLGNNREVKGSKYGQYLSFVDSYFPVEIRDQIYELVFVDSEPFHFGCPDNFEHSAALLRTCHQVHNEGRKFLYSKNRFVIERLSKVRGSAWRTNNWVEIGFASARRFVKQAGPTNLGLIRDLSLELTDADPNLTRHLTPFDRRFVNDLELHSILRSLKHCNLRKLVLSFSGE